MGVDATLLISELIPTAKNYQYQPLPVNNIFTINKRKEQTQTKGSKFKFKLKSIQKQAQNAFAEMDTRLRNSIRGDSN